MRTLKMALVAVSLMSPVVMAKDTPKTTTTENKKAAQPMKGPTNAEIDEAHKMNKEYDAKKAKEANQAQPMKGPTNAEIDEAHKMNKEYDAKKAAEKKTGTK